jgi:RNA polymerase sigma-70 factor (ECF subfamily)
VKVTVENTATANGVDTDLARLFDAHAAKLLRYCACRVGPDTAEDLVAQIFLVAVSGRAVYDPTRGSELTWLYGIATHLVRGHRRAESRRLAGYARAAEPDVGVEFAVQADDRIDAVATHRRVARAMARLPARQREVLLLVAVAELEYAEIAAVLDIPIGSVRSALHRARTKIRSALAMEDSNG